MAKKNYSKGEQQIEAARQTYQKKKLLEEFEKMQKGEKDVAAGEYQKAEDLLEKLRKNLITLRKENKSLYDNFKSRNADLEKYIDSPSSLKPEDWEFLKSAYEELSKISQVAENIIGESNERVIEKERKLSKNKRHNIKEGWWPI